MVDDLLKYKRLDGVDAALKQISASFINEDRQRLVLARPCRTWTSLRPSSGARRTASFRRPMQARSAIGSRPRSFPAPAIWSRWRSPHGQRADTRPNRRLRNCPTPIVCPIVDSGLPNLTPAQYSWWRSPVWATEFPVTPPPGPKDPLRLRGLPPIALVHPRRTLCKACTSSSATHFELGSLDFWTALAAASCGALRRCGGTKKN